MRLSTLRSGLILVTLLTTFFSAGLGTVMYSYFEISAESEDIQLPGTPIDETVFSSLVSDERDQAVFQGEFIELSHRPCILEFRYNTVSAGVIADEDALEISRRFIPSRYTDRFNSFIVFRDERFPSIRVSWEGSSQDGISATTYINAITGRVYSYGVGWYPVAETSLGLEPINRDGSPANRTVIEDRLASFMTFHNYTLPRSTRLIECAAYPNEDNVESYMFRFGIVHDKVLVDTEYEGALAMLDAVTGEVFCFKYLHIEGGNIPTDGITEPDVVYQEVIASSRSTMMQSEYLQHFIRLKNLVMPLTDIRVAFQLTWAFLFHNEEGYLRETYADAFDGSEPGYIRGGDMIPDMFNPQLVSGVRNAFIITTVALTMSVCVYSVTRRWIGKSS